MLRIILGGVKVYKVLLTQIGTNNPVATVLVNTLGGDIVWTRVNVGIYSGTLNGAFPANKTYAILSSKFLNIIRADDNSVGLLIAGSDSQLSGTAVLIEIYP